MPSNSTQIVQNGIQQIYEDLAVANFLERSKGGFTQNSNENLNWSMRKLNFVANSMIVIQVFY